MNNFVLLNLIWKIRSKHLNCQWVAKFFVKKLKREESENWIFQQNNLTYAFARNLVSWPIKFPVLCIKTRVLTRWFSNRIQQTVPELIQNKKVPKNVLATPKKFEKNHFGQKLQNGPNRHIVAYRTGSTWLRGKNHTSFSPL